MVNTYTHFTQMIFLTLLVGLKTVSIKMVCSISGLAQWPITDLVKYNIRKLLSFDTVWASFFKCFNPFIT